MRHNRDKTRFAFPLLAAVCLGIGASPYPFVLVVCLNLKEVSVPERAGLCSPASAPHGCGFIPARQEVATRRSA